MQRALLAPRADLGCPVFAIAHVHAAVGHAVAIDEQHVHIQSHTHAPGKGHLGHGGQQAAVAAVVKGQNFSIGAQGVDGVHQSDQQLRIVQIGGFVAHLVQGLRQHTGSHARLAPTQIDEQQRAVHTAVQLRRERAAHIGQADKSADDEGHGGADFFDRSRLRVRPLRAHGQRIFAHRNRDAQRGAEFQAHGLHRGVERGVFTGLAASSHPVRGELDARQLKRRGQQIRNGLGHRHAARCGGVERGKWRALAHGHGFTGKALVIGQRHRAVGHRHLPGADHLVAVGQASHGAVANGDQKAFGRHGGMGQHAQHRVLQAQRAELQRRETARKAAHVALHFGWLAQQHIHGHIDRCVALFVGEQQIALLGRHADHGKGAAFARTQGLKAGQRIGADGQHIALLAFVAPDLFGRHAGLFEWHGAHVETGAAPSVVGQLREGIGQAASAHIMDSQYGVVLALQPALVDDLLRAALDFGVTALHGVEVQVSGVGAGSHGTGRAAAHTDAHARTAELHQQAACGEENFVGLPGVDDTQATGNHDGLVVAALHRINVTDRSLFVFAEVAQQVRAAELVVERRATQGAVDHDVQRAGNVRRFAKGLTHFRPQARDAEAGERRLGLGAAPGGTFVADLAARAGGRAGERRDGGGVVVGFHLHQNMLRCSLRCVARRDHRAAGCCRHSRKTLHLRAFHHRGVVRIGHQHVLRVGLVGVADHAEQAVRLVPPVDAEVGVENFVAAVFAVGLGEHHQLDIGGVALQAGEGVHQVVHLVIGQRQTESGVGPLQRGAPTAQHIHMLHGRGLQRGEQSVRRVQAGQGALRHAVVQQGGSGEPLRRAQRGLGEQAAAQPDAVDHHALNTRQRQAAVAGDIAGFGGPGRNGSQTGCDHAHDSIFGRCIGSIAVLQQGGKPRMQGCAGRVLRGDQVHILRADAGDVGAHPLQGGQQTRRAESGQGVAAGKGAGMQGQGNGRRWGKKTAHWGRASARILASAPDALQKKPA